MDTAAGATPWIGGFWQGAKRGAPWLIPAVFTLAGAYAVLHSLGSLAAVSRVRPRWGDLVWVAGLYLLFATARGLRFRALLSLRQSWTEAVGVGMVYSAATSVFPGGLGEASVPMLYRGFKGGSAAGTAALLVSRVQDVLSWLPLLAIAGLTPAGLTGMAKLLMLFAVVGCAAATGFVFAPRLRRWLLGQAGRLPLPRLHGFLASFDAHLDGMVGHLDAWLLTLALRALSVGYYYFALRAFGVGATLGEAAVGGACVALLLVFPFQGVAGLGTSELWWIMALRLFGVPWALAAVAAVGLHLSLLLISVIAGGVAFRAVPRLVAGRGEG